MYNYKNYLNSQEINLESKQNYDSLEHNFSLESLAESPNFLYLNSLLS